MTFCLVKHLRHAYAFSVKAFGPPRGDDPTAGVRDHLRKELDELDEEPNDLDEWIDVVILGLDGALRAGHTPNQIVHGLVAKQEKNERRKWPDWRTAPPGKAIEHVRGYHD